MSEVIVQEEKKEKGASLVEYALLLALIAVVAIGGLRILGGEITTKFSDISSTLRSQPG